jgi:hypothetical protein
VVTELFVTGLPWAAVVVGVLGCAVALAFVPLVGIATGRKGR